MSYEQHVCMEQLQMFSSIRVCMYMYAVIHVYIYIYVHVHVTQFVEQQVIHVNKSKQAKQMELLKAES